MSKYQQLRIESIYRANRYLSSKFGQIEYFIFFVDFIVINMEGFDFENQILIIFGSLFLTTVNECLY